MLQPNGNSRKIRESDLVSIPYCPVGSSQTRGGKRYVFEMPTWCARHVNAGWQKQSGFKTLRRRRTACSSAVLGALSGFDQVFDKAPAGDITSVDCGSWGNVGFMDKTQKSTRAVWITTLRFLAATGTTARTPVHDARTGTTLPRTRTTTSGRALSVTMHIQRSANATAWQADQSTCGQPALSCFGKYISGFGITSSRKSKSEADFFMVKKHRHLIDQIVAMDNLQDAYRKTAKGKKMTFGYLEFKEYDQLNLKLIQEELADGAYKIGAYREFTIYEPKPRLISALDFKDRLVQHALCNIVSPIFEKTLMPQTFACRVGMGTHAGVRFVQSSMRRLDSKYFLKTDYSKFFPSIDRVVLHSMIDRKIDCNKTLRILQEIIPTFDKGIPIGSLTSQLFANVYGNVADRFIHFDLKHKHWARYMDDIVILDDDKARLIDSFLRLNDWSMEHLKLRIGKWQVSPTSRGVNFLGYRIWKTHKLLRKDSVLRAKRKIARYIDHQDQESLSKFVASWSGHAKWADTHHLFNWLEKKHGIIT